MNSDGRKERTGQGSYRRKKGEKEAGGENRAPNAFIITDCWRRWNRMKERGK